MRILLIHTGGTIGMVQTDDGFAPGEGVVEAAIADLVAAGAVAADVDIHKLAPLIDSAEATPSDWLRIAETIFEAMEHYDGFVVTHGTDTLAYTAGALCLALPGLKKPVVVTGAMLPLSVQGSDGGRNLKDALTYAAQGIAGVRVQFAGRLLHGARVRKSHSSAFDAFEAEDCAVEPVVPRALPWLQRLGQFKVGVFSVTPQPCTDLLSYAVERCDALLLRCYGSGTAPDTPEMRRALRAALDRQVPIVAVSQCPEGGMKLGTYAAGKVMRDNGVIDGRDITPEMAYVKLHFGLSQSTDYQSRRAYLEQCLCGELSALRD